MLLALLAGSVVLFYRSLKRDIRVLPYSTLGLVFAIYLSLDGLFQPAVLRVKSDKPVAEHLATLVPSDAVLCSFNPGYPAPNSLHPFTLNFYLKNRIMPFYDVQPQEGFLVAGAEEIEEFRRRYGATYDMQEVWDSGHRSCDSKLIIQLYKIRKKNGTASTGNPE